MLRRTFLGLDITAEGLRAVAMRRTGRGPVLVGGKLLRPAEGVLAPSAREPNVLDPTRFVADLHDLLGELSGREDRLALSLPDASGRVLLTELETPFKSRAEGREILKWHLKKSLPEDPGEVHLDYQILEKTETGRYRILVGLISRGVLQQYEELLIAAGYSPVLVDLHAANLYNYYQPRIDLGEDFIFVGVESGTLSLQFFQDGSLIFSRARGGLANSELVFNELNRSLVPFREEHAGFRRAAIFLHSDWDNSQELVDALRSVFEREVVVLDPYIDRLAAGPLQLASPQSMTLAAAIGAAERLM